MFEIITIITVYFSFIITWNIQDDSKRIVVCTTNSYSANTSNNTFCFIGG